MIHTSVEFGEVYKLTFLFWCWIFPDEDMMLKRHYCTSYVQRALGVFILDIAVLLFKCVIKMNTTEISSMKSALTCKVSLLFFLTRLLTWYLDTVQINGNGCIHPSRIYTQAYEIVMKTKSENDHTCCLCVVSIPVATQSTITNTLNSLCQYQWLCPSAWAQRWKPDILGGQYRIDLSSCWMSRSSIDVQYRWRQINYRAADYGTACCQQIKAWYSKRIP